MKSSSPSSATAEQLNSKQLQQAKTLLTKAIANYIVGKENLDHLEINFSRADGLTINFPPTHIKTAINLATKLKATITESTVKLTSDKALYFIENKLDLPSDLVTQPLFAELGAELEAIRQNVKYALSFKATSYDEDTGIISTAKRHTKLKVGNNVFYSPTADDRPTYYKIKNIDQCQVTLKEINGDESPIEPLSEIILDLTNQTSLSSLHLPRSNFKKANDKRSVLISENQNYELWEDSEEAGDGGLRYVRFRGPGLRKIVNNYQTDLRYKDNNIRIDVIDFDDLQSEEETINAIAGTLADDESRGFIYLEMDDGLVNHAAPFFLTKKGEMTTLVNFENDPDCDLSKLREDIIVKKINPAKDYFYKSDFGSQADLHSCTVFALNTLKHCFDPEFINRLKTEEGEYIDLPKTSLGQTKPHKSFLPEDKKEKYFISERNYKAFYKGHDLAQKLNPYHNEGLNKITAMSVEVVDSRRALRKLLAKEATSQDSLQQPIESAAASSAIDSKSAQPLQSPEIHKIQTQ